MNLTLKILSLLICILIFIGIYYRKNKKRHVPIMLTAFTLDVTMVLYIELTRHAIKTSLHPPHPFVTFHVVISVVVMILYLVQIWAGIKLYRGGKTRNFHRKIAVLFIIFRLGNLVTSFFVDHFTHLPLID